MSQSKKSKPHESTDTEDLSPSIRILSSPSSGTDESELLRSKATVSSKESGTSKTSVTAEIHTSSSKSIPSKKSFLNVSDDTMLSTSFEISSGIGDITSSLSHTSIHKSQSGDNLLKVPVTPDSSSSGIASAILSPSKTTSFELLESRNITHITSLPGTSTPAIWVECPEPELKSFLSDESIKISGINPPSPIELSTAGGPFLPRRTNIMMPTTTPTSLLSRSLRMNEFGVSAFLKTCIVKGVRKRSTSTKGFYCCFFGIPYAHPPVGKLRFKAPVPIEELPNYIDATNEKDMCIQQRYFNSDVLIGSEDCLHLTVYTPMEPAEIIKPLPVMVYIHGGGFFSGSGKRACRILLIKGFLNLEQSFCPGNMGLKDQVIALKWVQQNIRSFGGDPNNVTIFGSSAGAASVNLHMLSPLSKGLFHKAIMQSGNIYSPWGMARNTFRFTLEIVKLMGGPTSFPKAMLEFLENEPIERLVRVAVEVNQAYRNLRPLSVFHENFGPVVECYKDGAFLPAPPEELMKNAYIVPTIAGLNNCEGMLEFSPSEFILPAINNKLDEVLSSNFRVPVEQCIEPAKLLQSYHFKRKNIDISSRQQLLYTDIYFYRFFDAINFLVTPTNSVYIYEFAYHGNRNLFMNLQVERKYRLPGAAHSDELGYLFGQRHKYTVSEIENMDAKIIDMLCCMWTNFATTGNPTKDMKTEWKQFSYSSPSYLRIDKKFELKKGKLYNDRFGYMKHTVENIKAQF
ncbi:hypothetical protein PGB90_000040 [Kerria lacca]